MRFIVRGLLAPLLVLLILVPLLVLGGLSLCFQSTPLVPEGQPIAATDIERARVLLHRHDPRRTRAGIQRAVALSPRDLELLIDQAGRRATVASGMGDAASSAAPRSRVRLAAGTAVVQASLATPRNPLGAWLNIELTLGQTNALPEVQSLRLGLVPIPGRLAELALPHLLEAMGVQAQGDLAQRIVSRVQFTDAMAVVAFAWPDRLRESLSGTLFKPEDEDRLRMYVERLAAVAPARNADRRVPLATLMPPLFALARQRAESGQSADRESRSALLALALVANPGALNELVPASRRWAPVRPMLVLLRGRQDTPLHFLISAVLAAEGGGPLSDAIGVYKEVSDSRGGSGFSFNDLAADRAGTRLGLHARRDPQAVLQRLAAPLSDDDLLPDVSDLPEDMPEPVFKRRFGGVDAPAYREVLAGIEQRLDRLPLLRN
jgi:uncharacterized protein YfiM (DUF2279 family)